MTTTLDPHPSAATDTTAPDSAATVLAVEDPEELAARCWNAGLTVMVHSDAGTTTLSVIDPTGRRIDLVRETQAADAAAATNRA